MYTRTLTLLQSIHVRCVLAMLQVVGRAIYAIVVLDGYIRSVLVFKTQQSIYEPNHSTETTTATNSNTRCRWEFIHHHAIQRKWHRQQTDGMR